MKKLPEHIERSIRERRLLRRGERILVAVSGGLDSVVLLHLLHELAPSFAWKLRVAHFNHQLRGRASVADERFVQRLAAQLGLPFLVGRGDVRAVAKRKGLSIEMAARELRHRFLAGAARRLNCRVIAVAHHADDQVELFLLRLLRGAGGDGLGGMKWQSASPADQRVQMVRPLLDVSKEALRRFALAQGIRHREDATNTSTDLLRNRVRHELLPLLSRRFQPALDRTILRTMENIGADAELAAEAARAWLRLKPTKRRWAVQPVGLQRRVLQQQLQRLDIPADFDLIELLRRSPGRSVTVAADQWIQSDGMGRVRLVSLPRTVFRGERAVAPLTGRSGSVKFSGAEIIWRKAAGRGAIAPGPAAEREVFDADRVGSSIIVRHWQAGDRFQPIGMAAAVKLQDWFINRKIARARRSELLVATTRSGEIFWIEDQRIGERFKLTSATRNRLVWQWKRAETT